MLKLFPFFCPNQAPTQNITLRFEIMGSILKSFLCIYQVP